MLHRRLNLCFEKVNKMERNRSQGTAPAALAGISKMDIDKETSRCQDKTQFF